MNFRDLSYDCWRPRNQALWKTHTPAHTHQPVCFSVSILLCEATVISSLHQAVCFVCVLIAASPSAETLMRLVVTHRRACMPSHKPAHTPLLSSLTFFRWNFLYTLNLLLFWSLKTLRLTFIVCNKSIWSIFLCVWANARSGRITAKLRDGCSSEKSPSGVRRCGRFPRAALGLVWSSLLSLFFCRPPTLFFWSHSQPLCPAVSVLKIFFT